MSIDLDNLKQQAQHDAWMGKALGLLAPKGTWLCDVLENLWRASSEEEACQIALRVQKKIETAGLFLEPTIEEECPEALEACSAKHTKFQPKDSEWKCPLCGIGIGEFYIDEPDGHTDCPALHVQDCVKCYKCNRSWTGLEVSKLIEKKLNKKAMEKST
jgi:hypothetical protein